MNKVNEAMIGYVHILCIINNLSNKEIRFNELQRAMDGLSPVTLSKRLKKLESVKLIIRKEDTLDKLSVVIV